MNEGKKSRNLPSYRHEVIAERPNYEAAAYLQ
jgi:hypothetical protein